MKSFLIFPLLFHSVFFFGGGRPQQEARTISPRQVGESPHDSAPPLSLASGQSLGGAVARPGGEKTRLDLGTAAARSRRLKHGGYPRRPRPNLQSRDCQIRPGGEGTYSGTGSHCPKPELRWSPVNFAVSLSSFPYLVSLFVGPAIWLATISLAPFCPFPLTFGLEPPGAVVSPFSGTPLCSSPLTRVPLGGPAWSLPSIPLGIALLWTTSSGTCHPVEPRLLIRRAPPFGSVLAALAPPPAGQLRRVWCQVAPKVTWHGRDQVK